MKYDQARELFATAKGDSKPLQNNTRLFWRAEGFAIRLHSTDVVLIRPDNTYVLNSGGWQTNTTKDRINYYSPARLWQRKGEWYLSQGSDSDPIPFVDGIIIDDGGLVVGEYDIPAGRNLVTFGG
jgi:hypothetical protein